MKKQFEVTYRSFVIIEAESFEEARELFVKDHHVPIEAESFYDCDTGDNKDVIGYCEISELPIFEGEEYECDSEGVMWLKKFNEN